MRSHTYQWCTSYSCSVTHYQVLIENTCWRFVLEDETGRTPECQWPCATAGRWKRESAGFAKTPHIHVTFRDLYHLHPVFAVMRYRCCGGALSWRFHPTNMWARPASKKCRSCRSYDTYQGSLCLSDLDRQVRTWSICPEWTKFRWISATSGKTLHPVLYIYILFCFLYIYFVLFCFVFYPPADG